MPKPLNKSNDGPQGAKNQDSGIIAKVQNFISNLFKKHKVTISLLGALSMAFLFKKNFLDKFVSSSDIMTQINQKAFKEVRLKIIEINRLSLEVYL